RVLLRGVLSTQAHLAVSLAFLAAGSLIGLYLVAEVGLPLFVLGLFGVAIAYSYVGPPFRLAHHVLGEIAVALELVPVTVLGPYLDCWPCPSRRSLCEGSEPPRTIRTPSSHRTRQ